MSEHRIEPERRALHGHFSRELAPILTVAPGEVVEARTLDAGWGLHDHRDPFAPPPKFTPRDRELDRGHALCGPVAVRGARPDMTLVVRLESIRPGGWGWSSAGGYPSPLNQRLGLAEPPEEVLRWAIDAQAGTARNQHGRTLRIRPFMGILGMPPDLPGRHSTFPPRWCGGNIDCRELVEGSTLHLPIPVEGALFSLGDGHALQGDGEVAGPALECPMDRVRLRLDLESRALAMPRAETPAGWIAFGFHEDLDEAMVLALDGMLDLMTERHGLSRKEALALASLVVQLRVTQVVNGVRGVHAVLSHGALEGVA